MVIFSLSTVMMNMCSYDVYFVDDIEGQLYTMLGPGEMAQWVRAHTL